MLCALWVTGLAGGCGEARDSGAAVDPAGVGRSAEQPRRGGTLVVGVIADMPSVNPYTTLSASIPQEVATLQFLSLMEEQPDFTEAPPTLLPRLAVRWEYSDDRRSVTFHLREDVKWSDGVPVTAEDVRFTWQAQIHPAVAWDSAYYKESITDVEVIDEHTVRFHVERDAVHLLAWINEGEIIPRHAWSQLPFERWNEQAEWFLEHLVVNGPYQVTDWKPQQEIILERNARYFEPDLPRIDRMVIRVVADRTGLINQLLGGRLDLIFGISISDTEQIAASERVALLSYWSRGHAFLAWNNRDPLFRDPRVRRALTMGIDREAIIETTYSEYARMAVSPILSNVWAYHDGLEPVPYDPDQARALLAEAGWTDSDGDGILDRGGKPFRFELATNVGNQQREDTTILVQQQLRQLGIDVRLRYGAFGPLMEQANRGNYQAVVMRWSMPTDLDMTFAYHTDSIASGSNLFGYSNPELDALLLKAQAATDPESLRQDLIPIQELIVRDQPATFLYEPKDLLAYNRRLHFGDHSPNALRRLWHAWEWWIEPQR